MLWGIGGLTFGLTVRYLGIALGVAVALGLCAAFGTLMPPLFGGSSARSLARGSGQVVLLGVLVCLAGIAVSGLAGVCKEREVSEEEKKAAVPDSASAAGWLVAVVCGIMSASLGLRVRGGQAARRGARCAHGAPRSGRTCPC